MWEFDLIEADRLVFGSHFDESLPTAENKDMLNRLLGWSDCYQKVAFFSNGRWGRHDFEMVLGLTNEEGDLDISSVSEATENRLWFGFLSYDLKDQYHRLSNRSKPENELGWSLSGFFEPSVLIRIKGQRLTISSNLALAAELYAQILDWKPVQSTNVEARLVKRTTRDQYITDVERIRWHIEEGDVYELNYCMEFMGEGCFDPVSQFIKLLEISPTPFSSFLKLGDQYLLCASPERFLKKRGGVLISEPIKGTARRSVDADEDSQIKFDLQHSEKERAENMMIVDLVRNDLARVSVSGTVKVKDLFRIDSYEYWHQMVSSIHSQVKPELGLLDIIKATFPMGSMTGAPKLMAMELIDRYEPFKRGIYAGSVGFVLGGDFDLNVVIRSLAYDHRLGRFSFAVGSAITYDSVPAHEYEECLIKAGAITKILGIEL